MQSRAILFNKVLLGDFNSSINLYIGPIWSYISLESLDKSSLILKTKDMCLIFKDLQAVILYGNYGKVLSPVRRQASLLICPN